jgi:hypothetical protein
MKKIQNELIVLLGFIFLCTSCDLNIGGGKDLEDPPATEILRFTFSPSKVVSVGDILTITCVVKDSLDTNLRYSWGVGIHAAQYSESNSITFLVKEDTGVVRGGVTIQKLNSATEHVRGDFQFEIRNK